MNFQKRLQNVSALHTEKKLDCFLISCVSNIFYLTGYTGFSETEREAYVLVTSKNIFLFTDARYTDAVNKIAHITLKEISAKTPVLAMLEEIISAEQIKTIGFEANNLTVAEYKHLKKKLSKLTPLSLDNVRLLKDEEEIKNIENACRIGDATFHHLLTLIKPGISEKELAAALEHFIKQQGADSSFRPIVAFGKNAAVPHHLTSDQRLTTRDLILLDFGVKCNGYCSDMTRTVFLGKATNEQKKMYNAVLKAQTKAFDFLNTKYKILNTSGKPIKSSDIDQIARQHIVAQGYPSIPHSVGHGIGIEVHEVPSLSPKSKDTLKPGMVFSIEPGIYIPEFGGVRIEDLVIIEPTGPRFLTHAPKALIEL